jgi:hypothetical protein
MKTILLFDASSGLLVVQWGRSKQEKTADSPLYRRFLIRQKMQCICWDTVGIASCGSTSSPIDLHFLLEDLLPRTINWRHARKCPQTAHQHSGTAERGTENHYRRISQYVLWSIGWPKKWRTWKKVRTIFLLEIWYNKIRD